MNSGEEHPNCREGQELSGKGADIHPIVARLDMIIELIRRVMPKNGFNMDKEGAITPDSEEVSPEFIFSGKPAEAAAAESRDTDDTSRKIDRLFEQLTKIETKMKELAGSGPAFAQEDAVLNLLKDMDHRLGRLEENIFESDNSGGEGLNRDSLDSLHSALEGINDEMSAMKAAVTGLGKILSQDGDDKEWEDLRSALDSIQEEVGRLPKSFPEPPDISGELDKLKDKVDDIEAHILSAPDYKEKIDNLASSIRNNALSIHGAVDKAEKSLNAKLEEHFKSGGVDYNRINRQMNAALAERQEEIKKAQERFEKGVAEGLGNLMKLLSSLEQLWRNELGPALSGEGEKSILSSLKALILPKYDDLHNNLHSEWQRSSGTLNMVRTDLDQLKNDILEQNRTLAQENSDAQRGLDLAREKLEQAAIEKGRTREELESLKAECKRLQEKAQVLETQLGESRSRNEELGQKISAKDKVLEEESGKSARLEEQWKPWQDRLDFYAPVQAALRSSPFFSDFADSEQIFAGEEGLFNCMKSLGRSSDFLRAVHEYASREKTRAIKENRAEPMQEDEIRVYDALNKCYRVLLGKDFDYFVQSGDRPVTVPFEKVRFNKTNDRHMREPNDRSRAWVQRIYVPMLRNDEGVMLKPAEVEAGND